MLKKWNESVYFYCDADCYKNKYFAMGFTMNQKMLSQNRSCFHVNICASSYAFTYKKSYVMIVINLSETRLSRKMLMSFPEDVHTFVDNFPRYAIVVIILCYKQISAFCLSCLIDSFANVWRCFHICIKEWE